MSLSNAMGATGGPPKEIVICRDWDDLGDQAALSFVRFAQEAVSLRGRFSAALAGGATPGRFTGRWQAPRLQRRFPGSRSTFFGETNAPSPPIIPIQTTIWRMRR
ncbi:MAG: hypothetical protein MPW15_20770 [Candidatus Manganitrophus sp.]|nr:hypothetical protein [Candidatus Manganitrophus sp.]